MAEVDGREEVLVVLAATGMRAMVSRRARRREVDTAAPADEGTGSIPAGLRLPFELLPAAAPWMESILDQAAQQTPARNRFGMR